VIRTITEGPLAERFAFESFGTTTRRAPRLSAPLRLLNSAVARAVGLSDLMQLETWAKLRAFRARLDAGPDLVHLHASHGYDLLLSALFARSARRRGIPSLLHTHGNYDVFLPRSSAAERRAFRRALEVPDRVIVLSDGWRRWFSDWMDPARIVVLRNCVDASRFRPRYERPPGEHLVLLFVGMGEPVRKGAYDLLACAPEIARRVPGVRLVCVGADVGGLEASHVKGTPLAQWVEFVGSEGPGRIEGRFEEADVLLLPSYAEGLPIVLLEAMAAGLPVIATPVNGVPEAMRAPEHGLFIEPGDRAALVAAVAELAGDPGRRAEMGRAGRRRILESFDVRAYADSLGALYDELLGAPAMARA
jgi:glycosyltransferase involved in cell wall biosynthesis